jgi:hypothetical protein
LKHFFYVKIKPSQTRVFGFIVITRCEYPSKSGLRTVCADLAGLRRSDHYVERLRIGPWRDAKVVLGPCKYAMTVP